MEQEKQVLALGFFDGVHRGHQALLQHCRELSREVGAAAAALTFDTHPQGLLQGQGPGLLCSLQDRKRWLGQFGMEQVHSLPFDEHLRTMPWQDFFRLLFSRYGAAGIVCGDDYRFGYRGQGTAALLREACAQAGIPCRVVPEQTLEGHRISSSHIRQLLARGDMAAVARFLGHSYTLTGRVVQGQQLGRTIGVPTANLVWPEELAKPALGVYAARVVWEGRQYAAVTNIGTRPTVSGNGITVESWLQDFSGDLYGRELTLELTRYLRPEQKFATLEQLQEAIHRDARQARGCTDIEHPQSASPTAPSEREPRASSCPPHL